MEKLGSVSKCFIFLIPLIISFSSFVMGYFLAYLSMLETYFKIQNGFIQNQHQLLFTIVISAIPVGGFVGALLYNKLLQKLYENKLLIIMNVLAIIAITIQFITFYWPILIISRLLMGFYCGIISGLVPSYIMSISPSFTSGIIGSFHQTLIVLGIAFAYYMGQYKNYSNFSLQTTAKIIICFPLITIFINLIGLCIFPYNSIERYLKKGGQSHVLNKYLRMIYGADWRTFENQLTQFKSIPVEAKKMPFSSGELQNKEGCCYRFHFEQCYKRKKAFRFGLVLAITSQLSGSDTILQYAQQLFNIFQDGNKKEADRSIMILGFFQFAVTLLSGFLINKFGRRPMMLFGMTVILVALLSGFLITFLIDQHQSYTIWIIFIHIFGYSVSIGPLCFIYAVEILQNISIVLITYWGLSIITSLTFDVLIQSDEGVPLMFCLYFIGSFLCFVFLCRKMIETKSLSKKKIYEMIEQKSINWSRNAIVIKQKTNKNYPETNAGLVNQGLDQMVDSSKKKISSMPIPNNNIVNKLTSVSNANMYNDQRQREAIQNQKRDFI